MIRAWKFPWAVSKGHWQETTWNIKMVAIFQDDCRPTVTPSLMQLGLEKMWVAFGKGEKMRWISIHEVASAIGPEETRGILFSMPSVIVTLCHPSMANQRSLPGKQKRVWWGLKHIYNTRECPSAVKDSDLQALERFVVLMLCTTVNKARLDHFARKTIWLCPRSLSVLSPTS